jgi:predicted transcriptional regulator
VENSDRVKSIVTAYIKTNPLRLDELPDFISSISKCLSQIENGGQMSSEPAVPIAQSLLNERIYCLGCGEGFRTLTRHLKIRHSLTEQQYREKWQLPNAYPMQATTYLRERAVTARANGFKHGQGQKRKEVD